MLVRHSTAAFLSLRLTLGRQRSLLRTRLFPITMWGVISFSAPPFLLITWPTYGRVYYIQYTRVVSQLVHSIRNLPSLSNIMGSARHHNCMWPLHGQPSVPYLNYIPLILACTTCPGLPLTAPDIDFLASPSRRP